MFMYLFRTANYSWPETHTYFTYNVRQVSRLVSHHLYRLPGPPSGILHILNCIQQCTGTNYLLTVTSSHRTYTCFPFHQGCRFRHLTPCVYLLLFYLLIRMNLFRNEILTIHAAILHLIQIIIHTCQSYTECENISRLLHLFRCRIRRSDTDIGI